MWHITLTTQSGVMMTIAIVCGFLPAFFLSPFAGVWADRYNRKMLIIAADSFIAVSTLILALLFLMGFDVIWLLFVMSGLRALGTAVHTPAVGAIIPQLVPEDKLTKVNATNGSILALVMLVSPMVSAALLTMTSLEIIFFIDVITAIIAVLILFIFLRIPSHAKASVKQTTSYFNDLRQGYVYIKSNDYVKKFFMFCTFFFLLVAPVAFLTPLQVTRSFGSDVWRLTAIEIAFSIGMMLGGIFLASWGGFKNKIHTMTMACLLMGVCTFAMGIVSNYWVYLLFMAIVGVSLPMFNTPSTVLLQEKVEEDFHGRVFGVLGMITSVMMPLGMVIFGPLSDFIRIEWLLILTGLLMFIQSFFLINNKALIEAGKTNPKSPVDDEFLYEHKVNQ